MADELQLHMGDIIEVLEAFGQPLKGTGAPCVTSSG